MKEKVNDWNADHPLKKERTSNSSKIRTQINVEEITGFSLIDLELRTVATEHAAKELDPVERKSVPQVMQNFSYHLLHELV